MRQQPIRNHRKSYTPFNRQFERLLYLPGALILAYGLWLALTVNS